MDYFLADRRDLKLNPIISTANSVILSELSESKNPVILVTDFFLCVAWIPAYAGMTEVDLGLSLMPHTVIPSATLRAGSGK